jgi:Na+/proline symporter
MVDLLIVVAFVVYGLAAGLRARRQASSDLGAYFLAGRSLGRWSSGLSMTATQYAADTPLLAAGLIATGGVFALWRLWVYGVAFLLLGFVLGAAWWRSGVVTDAELCELRYDGPSALWLRGVKAVYYGVIFNCAVLAMVLVAAVRIAEPFLTWDVWLPVELFAHVEALVSWVGVPLAVDPTASDVWRQTASNVISIVAIFAFTVGYSSVGGLRSVVMTDMGQLAVLGVGTALYAVYATSAAGGLAALPGALSSVVGAPRARELLAFDPWAATQAGAAVLGVLGLQWLVQMNSDGTGYLAQRCMACRSADEARRAPIVFAFAQVLGRSLLWLPLLVALLIVFPLSPEQTVAERELTFVRGIELLLPPGVRGLILVGMLAALASTLDTHLNWGASYLTNDLYARLICERGLGYSPRPHVLVWVARACGPLLMLISLGVMAALGSIQQAWHITLLLGAGLGVPLLLRWVWHRANAWGELAAIGVSGLAAPLLLMFVETEAVRLLVVAALGSAASVVASLATRPVDPLRLRAFEQRVRPPGFWPRAGARRQLWRGLAATLAASGTLFCSLVALGSLLIGAPAPGALPRTPWIAGNLVVALALARLWWPLLTDEA